MRGRRAVAGIAVSLAVLSLAGIPAAVPAAAAPFEERCDPEPRGVPMRTEPWGQHRLDFKRVWAFTKGEGVLVAEVDSGVDATHPQLKDAHVLPTVDLTNTRTLDCNGHGTRVAGIIVGQDLGRQGIVFVGVAPEAHLLPIKQTDAGRNDNGAPVLAQGIRTAVDRGAKVINVSITTPGNVPELAAAVRYAQAHDVVIVAAAGNETSGSDSNRPQYPANYPGVIGVAAIDQKGERAGFSVTATRVSVAAPGDQIISTAAGPQHGYNSLSGTSFAAPFVTGVVALVRSYHPELNYQQVIHRIEVTADHSTDPALGFGVVNPYQAVTAVLPEENKRATPTPTIQAIPPLPKVQPPDSHIRNLALLLAGIGGGVTVLVLAGAVVVPRGLRRRWQPGQRVVADDADQPQALLT